MKLGCHAVLFAESFLTDADTILSELHECGAQGVEVGARFLGTLPIEQLLQLVEKNGMALSGIHCSVPLVDFIENPNKALETLSDTAKNMGNMAYKNIILTGLPDFTKIAEPDVGIDWFENEEKLHAFAVHLDDVCREIKAKFGVQIHYHNHNWEFKHNAAIFNALLSKTTEVCFALDIGWAATADFDPIRLIKNAPDRFRYIHLRDLKMKEVNPNSTFLELQNEFLNLGEGDINYPKLISMLKKNLSENDWLIIEYEKGEVSTKRYKAALDFLKIML